MYKSELINFIAKEYTGSKIEAEKVINIFTESIIKILGKGEEVNLLGFGNFTVAKVAARAGRNPQTGAAINIAAYNAVRFKVGKKFKDACNGPKNTETVSKTKTAESVEVKKAGESSKASNTSKNLKSTKVAAKK